jgi:hypothetical protein
MSTHSLCAQKQVSCIQIKRRLRKTNPLYKDQIDERFVKQSESSLWERKWNIYSTFSSKFACMHGKLI